MAKYRNFKEYDDLGVRFLYPNNWTVQTQNWDKGTWGISVDSPDGNFWALAIFPKDVDLDTAAQQILEQLEAEYDEVEREKIKRYVADYVLEGYEINFFYLDMTTTAQALAFQDENRGYVVFWQTCERLAVTDEELSRVDVFEVMTHTLVSNLTGQEEEYYDDADDDWLRMTERERRAEDDREFYRRRYEQARRDVQERYWRDGGTIVDENSGLEHFIRESRGGGDPDDVESRSGDRHDERLEDFLRPGVDSSEDDFFGDDEYDRDEYRDDEEDEL